LEKRVAPASTVARFPRRLTIGMATYNDYDGVYFTVQSIRMNNPELNGALEFVVIDNDPGGPCSKALSQLGNWIDGYRYVPRGEWSGTAIRNAVFEEASSPARGPARWPPTSARTAPPSTFGPRRATWSPEIVQPKRHIRSLPSPRSRLFSGDLLVGNFSFAASEINAFDPLNGTFLGTIPINVGVGTRQAAFGPSALAPGAATGAPLPSSSPMASMARRTGCLAP
jgi:hypothetical protein